MAQSTTQSVTNGTWTCTRCLYGNGSSIMICKMCDLAKPTNDTQHDALSVWNPNALEMKSNALFPLKRPQYGQFQADDELDHLHHHIAKPLSSETNPPPKHGDQQSAVVLHKNKWQCPQCTVVNHRSLTRCEVCLERRPSDPDHLQMDYKDDAVPQFEEMKATEPPLQIQYKVTLKMHLF